MRGISNFQFPISNYKEVFKYWLPVDWYNGGMEHTTLHLLYSRFVYKFLWDIGAVPKSCGPEPYRKRTSHGMILGKGNEKMSKSRGNVVTPDEVIEEFGADVLRIYEMFIGPFEQVAAWDSKGILGVKRFLDKVWNYLNADYTGAFRDEDDRQQWIAGKHGKTSSDIKMLLHQTIKKVGEDIEGMRFNTAISSLMILVNSFYREPFIDKSPGSEIIEKADFEKFLIILAPFAPHITEELWEKLGHKSSIHKELWPKYDEKLAKVTEIELVVQINGKVRDKIKVAAGISEQQATKLALDSERVLKYLEGKKVKKVIFVKGKLISIVV